MAKFAGVNKITLTFTLKTAILENVNMLTPAKRKEQINYWHTSALRNWQTAKSLFTLRHYEMCLFCCHLAIEKLIKGLVVRKTGETPPKIHDLVRLAQLAGLDLKYQQKADMEEITKFNVQARYLDIKFAFYKKATKEFSARYLKISEHYIVWLKKQYP